MARAMWRGAVLAESDDYIVFEGNYYFPPEAIRRELFEESDGSAVCPGKGVARYYDIVVDGEINRRAAWYYSEPRERAARIKDYVSFWKGVEIED